MRCGECFWALYDGTWCQNPNCQYSGAEPANKVCSHIDLSRVITRLDDAKKKIKDLESRHDWMANELRKANAERDEARAEAERLREALAYVMNYKPMRPDQPEIDDLQAVAMKALGYVKIPGREPCNNE